MLKTINPKTRLWQFLYEHDNKVKISIYLYAIDNAENIKNKQNEIIIKIK